MKDKMLGENHSGLLITLLERIVRERSLENFIGICQAMTESAIITQHHLHDDIISTLQNAFDHLKPADDELRARAQAAMDQAVERLHQYKPTLAESEGERNSCNPRDPNLDVIYA